MFPFQKGDLCFQVSNNNNNNNEQLVKSTNASEVDNMLKFSNNNNNNLNLNPPNKRKHWSNKKSCLAKQDDKTNVNYIDNIIVNNGDDDVEHKKLIHREIERQRRQEMTTLYSSLRSILPLEYVKGKRTMSDHISEATKYIKDLERNIKELGDKRLQLKESVGCSSSTRGGCNVSIHSTSKSIEIEICTGGGVDEQHPFPLSSVLKVLIEEGLDVVSCNSTQVNHKLIYVIYCQVEDVSSIDPSQLKWKLYNQICT